MQPPSNKPRVAKMTPAQSNRIAEQLESSVKAVLPDLVRAVVREQMDDWITEVTDMGNDHETRLSELEKHLAARAAMGFVD
jgi:Fe-S-cluster formation regulator IscX/YfhJ